MSSFSFLCLLKIMAEQWKCIDEFPGYSISNHGRYRNDETRTIRKPTKNSQGYYQAGLSNNKKRLIHRLVAIAFIPNKNSVQKTVDHIDNNRTNNHVSNLRWATYSEQSLNRRKRKKYNSKMRPVDMLCHQTDQFVKSFLCIRDAIDHIHDQTQLKCKYGAVTKACRTQQIYCGFRWRFTPSRRIKGERWSIMVDHNPNYQLSDHGRVLRPNGYITGISRTNAYPQLHIGKFRGYIHRLVAHYFLPPPPKGKCLVNHINGDRFDPRACNLEWVDHRENSLHAFHVLGKGSKKRKRKVNHV